MEVLNLIRLFWGWVSPYISLTYSLYDFFGEKTRIAEGRNAPHMQVFVHCCWVNKDPDNIVLIYISYIYHYWFEV